MRTRIISVICIIISVVIGMKLFIQRDVSDADARYRIFDEKGQPLWRVRGRLTPTGESMRLRDEKGSILCRIRRLGFGSLSAYRLLTRRESVYLNIAVSGTAAAARFRGISYCVRGDIRTGCYDIIDADATVVCSVYKDHSRGCIQLTINDNQRDILCTAAVLCIDSLKQYTVPVMQTV